MADRTVDELVDEGTRILRSYVRNPRTELLKQLAPVVVDLRSHFTLQDGRPDWGGRSPEYRQAMASVYTNARVPSEALDRLQSALRYHVGNLLRERVGDDELASVGMTNLAPRERIQTTREALYAMREVSAPRQDVARLAAYAEALLEFIDEGAIPDLPPERAEAARLALEEIRERATFLIGRIDGRHVEIPAPVDAVGERRQGRHRRKGA